MSRVEFFPYPVGRHALLLTYEVQSDGLELGDGRRILATALPETGSVKVALTVSVQPGTLERVLPPAELENPPVAVVAAVRSVTSRQRQAVRLHSADGVWKGLLDIPKQDLYREISIEPVLLRTAPGTDDAYADHLAAALAFRDRTTIEVDETPVRTGGFLEVKFDDFRESASPKRSAEPGLLYVLDTDRETPVLWLNEGVDELKAVMMATGPRGYNLRVRDAMFDTIVSQVWTSLLSLAVTNLALLIQEQREAEDDSDPLEALAADWQQRVISFWAPHLFAGTRAEALDDVIAAASDRRLLADLLDRVSVAVQKWAGTAKAFNGLIRMRDREGV